MKNISKRQVLNITEKSKQLKSLLKEINEIIIIFKMK